MDGPAGGTRAQLSSYCLLLQEPGPGPSEGWAALWVDVGPGSHPHASPDQGAGRACLLGRRGHSEGTGEHGHAGGQRTEVTVTAQEPL